MSLPNSSLEEIDYFHHCTSDKDGQNIIDYGLVPYSADDSFYDGKLCVPGSPDIVFFACFKFNGKDITRTPYPRTLDDGQSAVMLKFEVDQFIYKDYKLFELNEQTIHGAKHKKIFMVHKDHEKGLEFAEANNFQALNIKKNNYLRYDPKEKKWYSWKYEKGGLIIDIVFCSYNLPNPINTQFPMQYMGKNNNTKRKSIFYSISKESGITDIDYNIVNDNNKIQTTYKFTIVSFGIGLISGLQKLNSLNGASQTNHPFKKNLLNTTISCSNGNIEEFSMRINGNGFKTIKSLSESGVIAIVNQQTISMLTNLDELVNIFIIHTKKSPLSPQANIGKIIKESDGGNNGNLINEFNQVLDLNTNN
ncbi:hypothetical protein ACTFIW_004228 [Dictyostelium discoideum]